MLKEKVDKVKELMAKNEKEPKKKIENLVVLVLIIIITIIAINSILGDGDEEKQNNTATGKVLASSKEEQDLTNTLQQVDGNGVETDESTDLEKRLEEILKKITGVGEVNVMITYSESSEVVAMYNENTKETSTEETDTSGGKRLIEESDTQREIVYQEEDGNKTPITQKIIKPKIEGAIIVAEGSQNATVKTNIIQAVEAATGLPTHKIQVFY